MTSKAAHGKPIAMKELSGRVRDCIQKLATSEPPQPFTQKDVAAALIEALTSEHPVGKGTPSPMVREENIQRRVYDIVNVFDAIGMIKKGKGGLITWNGTIKDHEPESDMQILEQQRKRLSDQANKKQRQYEEMCEQCSLYKAAISFHDRSPPPLVPWTTEQQVTHEEDSRDGHNDEMIRFPFYVVCSNGHVTQEGEDERITLRSDEPFEVLQDVDIIKALQCSRFITTATTH